MHTWQLATIAGGGNVFIVKLFFVPQDTECPETESLQIKFAQRSLISKYDTKTRLVSKAQTGLQIPSLDFSRKSFNHTVTGLKTWSYIPTHIGKSETLKFKNGSSMESNALLDEISGVYKTKFVSMQRVTSLQRCQV